MTAVQARREHGMTGTGGVAGYKLRRTSQDLGKHWTHKVQSVSGGVIGIIGNAVTYAAPVQGPREVQARRMKAIGWPNVDDAVEQAGPDIDKAFAEATTRFLEAL